MQSNGIIFRKCVFATIEKLSGSKKALYSASTLYSGIFSIYLIFPSTLKLPIIEKIPFIFGLISLSFNILGNDVIFPVDKTCILSYFNIFCFNSESSL